MSTLPARLQRLLGGYVLRRRFAPLGRLFGAPSFEGKSSPAAPGPDWCPFYYLPRRRLFLRRDLPPALAWRLLRPLFADRVRVHLVLRAYSCRPFRALASPTLAFLPPLPDLRLDGLLATKYGLKLFDVRAEAVWTFSASPDHDARLRLEAQVLADLADCPVVLPLLSSGERADLPYFVQPLADARARFARHGQPNLPLFTALFASLACVYAPRLRPCPLPDYVETLLHHAAPVLSPSSLRRLRDRFASPDLARLTLYLTGTHSDLVEQNVVLWQGRPRLLDWANYSTNTFLYDLFMALQYWCLYYGPGNSTPLAEAVAPAAASPLALTLRLCAHLLARRLDLPLPDFRLALLLYLLERLKKYDFAALGADAPYAARLPLQALDELLPLLA